MKHDQNCERRNGYYVKAECRTYSTDGTRLGAEIAHTMGTTSEEEIIQRAIAEERDIPLTGMPEEQADWEDDEGWKW